ncbi:MAG TPA: glycoside hydrolase [Candidatus Paceibacterota bacterium]|nr:glycoside hydrolase [Verrucomicrobiota bacterium]HRZ47045.1 glycoside hydrolase [Candidatus Paceibacterota bacterium]
MIPPIYRIWREPRRLAGHWLLGLALVLGIDAFGAAAEPAAQWTLASSNLTVTLRGADGAIDVRDHRDGHTWSQKPAAANTRVARARANGQTLEFDLVQAGVEFSAILRIEPGCPEFTIEIRPPATMARPLAWPHPFTSSPGAWLVVPLNEGIGYPVDDPAVNPMRLIAYGGHGICMAFWGVADGSRGMLAILESPDDAAIRIARLDGRLVIAPEWDSVHGKAGYSRRLRYVLFDRGGHVAFAKRYRQYARQIGLLKTLDEKRRQNPNVDRLVGAVNVWCWDRDAVGIAREMQDAGIDRILWSNRQTPENLAALNRLSVLTSRYDIYQDVMDPAQFPRLRSVHPDWTTPAWPDDLMRGAGSDWIRGWQVRARDGAMIPCGVLCDRQALEYAARRIPLELETHPYLARFIDTTTASPWRECYDPDHSQTRSESRHWKMELLRYVSQDMRLVTGSETGHDAAVPFVHFFEGMLSLGPYRVPDAGRNMQQIVDEVPERVARFQVGHAYRLPLWELVYHDCVVAHWYWGDYNNKLPALWDRRDLFNALYGTPPMFMFTRPAWEQQRERFARSYRASAPIARAAGYAEMTDHQFLTADRRVQRTAFANGITVTVNFGPDPFLMDNGASLAPLSRHAAGIP